MFGLHIRFSQTSKWFENGRCSYIHIDLQTGESVQVQRRVLEYHTQFQSVNNLQPLFCPGSRIAKR